MLSQFKKELWLNRSSYLFAFIGEAALFLLGAIIVLLVMTFDPDPETSFPMGSLFAAMVLLMGLLFVQGFGYTNAFSLALSMGRTRRAFMLSFALQEVLIVLLGGALLLGMHALEVYAYPRLFPLYPVESLGAFFRWQVLFPVLALVCVVGTFLGALQGRFGTKIRWLVCTLWVALCLLGPRLADADPTDESLFGRAAIQILAYGRVIPSTAWIVMGVVSLIAMLAVIIQLGRTQSVR